MRETNTDELNINGHPEGLITRRNLIRLILLCNLPQERITLHSHARLTPLQEFKGLLTIKAAADKVAANLEVLRDVSEESIEGVLSLKEVVSGEHTRYDISTHLEAVCELGLNVRRYNSLGASLA